VKSRPAIILILVSVCFCIGMATVLLGEQGTASPITSILNIFPEGGPRWIESNRETRTTILLLGVDRLDSPDPALRAIWLLTINPPDTHVILTGVPTDLDLVPGADVRLDSFFAWTAQDGVAPPFLEALERALRIQIDTIAVMDETAFAELVDYVGGLPLGKDLGLPLEEQVLTGEQVLALHTVFSGDPVGLINLQANILQGLLPQGAKLPANPDLGPLLELVPQHARITIHEAQLAVLLSHILPLQSDQVEIRVVLAPVP
jgi:hypothetical protein